MPSKSSDSLYNKTFCNKEGKLALAQMPNLPIILWFVFMLTAHFIKAVRFSDGLQFLSSASLFTWAYLELFKGENYFRRALGFVVLLYIVVTKCF